ncbi:hypothetical protein AGOR_G00187400 [Albula goreensis]|uniref:RNase NYN domain-containing protein n=1 Tax=Albula goreensis TaxID=1534307 RepID=A0A8T3CYQ4_9TELE|nr:hypothetical protein AGOR_G00187400 [Albula goreensis]
METEARLQVEDEFAYPGASRPQLRSVQPLVERVFRVRLEEARALSTNDGQIWLKMRGDRREVEEAKLFVKGQVNEQEVRDVSYPEVLHSVFCGAGGLFLDCLIKYTCALIQVRSLGTLCISGLEEPVVRACSLVLDLGEKYEATKGWSAEAGAGSAGELLESRRAFRSLVERWEDRHTLDLLVLPATVKEALLGLIQDSGMDPLRDPRRERDREEGKEQERDEEGGVQRTTVPEGERQEEGKRFLSEGSPEHSTQLRKFPGAALPSSPFLSPSTPDPGEPGAAVQAQLGGLQSGVGLGEEFAHILRFFTAMGFSEGVVSRVLSRTGPTEPSQILDLVQQEQNGETDTLLPKNGVMGGAEGEVVKGPPQHTYPLELHPAPLPTVVTGEQRFYEVLQTPFTLTLSPDPGDQHLRQVIIDGSNVAMSHGLGQFFSCRGIALAVQHFWNRGHRRVTAFVPQWRQKRDPKVKEQHYLTKLQDLALLAFTPSREVQGKRINSYDDRFMLQLAQKTDGVIVTNDNLRDLLDESPAFNSIIRRRLLQYTFVGDHFMVPDDPLGRGGPHLNDFLRSKPRSVVSGSHTFAGVSPPFSPAPLPPQRHAQTEVLQYRTQPAGGGAKPGKGAGRGGRGDSSRLREHLLQVFPGEDSLVTMALHCNPGNTDINELSELILKLKRERAEDR